MRMNDEQIRAFVYWCWSKEVRNVEIQNAMINELQKNTPSEKWMDEDEWKKAYTRVVTRLLPPVDPM